MVRLGWCPQKYGLRCKKDDAGSTWRSTAKSQGLDEGSSCPTNKLSEFGLKSTDLQFSTDSLIATIVTITPIHRGSDCNCLLLQSSECWTDDHRAAYPCGEWSTRRSTGIRSSGIGWAVSPPSCSVSRTSISQRTGRSYEGVSSQVRKENRGASFTSLSTL